MRSATKFGWKGRRKWTCWWTDSRSRLVLRLTRKRFQCHILMCMVCMSVEAKVVLWYGNVSSRSVTLEQWIADSKFSDAHRLLLLMWLLILHRKYRNDFQLLLSLKLRCPSCEVRLVDLDIIDMTKFNLNMMYIWKIMWSTNIWCDKTSEMKNWKQG